MKFKINAEEFAQSLKPALEVATKNISNGCESENRITLKSDDDGIIAYAYGGTASVISPINDANFGNISYKSEENGEVTVAAYIMMESLLVFGSEDVQAELQPGQLVLSLVSDKDISQPIPVFDKEVKVPPVATDFSKEVLINREVFVEGLNKVSFAVAFEERKRNLMCVLFESSKKKIRFAAGSGQRFAVSDIEGKNVGSVSKIKIIFPKNNLSSISKILAEAPDKDITIKYAVSDPKNDAPEQIVIEFNGMSMGIFAIDSSIRYHNLDEIIDFGYPNKIYSDVEDWSRAVAGIAVTMKIESDVIHNTEVIADTEKECFKIETKTLLKAKSKVNFTNDTNSVTNNPNPWFRCNSVYLKEVSSKAGKSGEILFSFENQEKLKDLPDDEKRMKPILVEFPENPNEARDTIEKFYMFFSASTK